MRLFRGDPYFITAFVVILRIIIVAVSSFFFSCIPEITGPFTSVSIASFAGI
jgi:hypothetical protein